jgi:hypothetical protein
MFPISPFAYYLNFRRFSGAGNPGAVDLKPGRTKIFDRAGVFVVGRVDLHQFHAFRCLYSGSAIGVNPGEG